MLSPCSPTENSLTQKPTHGTIKPSDMGGSMMYLPIGGDMAVRTNTIVGIFDLDNTTTSQRTRQFLQSAEQEGQVVSASEDLPKAFLLTSEYGLPRVYLTQFNAATLEKRLQAAGREPRAQL